MDVFQMGILDRVLQRDPLEQANTLTLEGDNAAQNKKWKKAFNQYKKAVNKYGMLNQEDFLLKTLPKLGEAAIKVLMFKQAQEAYCQVARLHLDRGDYHRSAEFFELEAITASNAKKKTQFQVAVLLGGLSYLLSGNHHQADKFSQNLCARAVELSLPQDFFETGTPGKILENLVIGIINGRITKQLITNTRNQVKMLKLPKNEQKLVDSVIQMLERRLKARLGISTHYLEIPLNTETELQIELNVDQKIKIVQADLKLDPTLTHDKFKPQKGNFVISIKPKTEGHVTIGPLVMILKDQTGYQFELQSNTIKLQVLEKVSDLKLGFQPTKLPIQTESEVVFSVKNIGNSNLYNLNFEFSFSQNIETRLGSTQKRVNSLGPNEVLRLPLTIFAVSGSTATVSAKYQFEDTQSQLQTRNGEVQLTLFSEEIDK